MLASKDKVVIVTGASAGIGRAVALRLARAGWSVGLIARDESALHEMRQTIEAAGGSAAVAPADVADAGAVFSAAARLESMLGPVDVWINDAMETVFSTLEDTNPQEFRRVTEVTYLGCVHGTMAALKSMRERRRGRIVQMGSALAYRGIPLQSAYCGAKHAIRGFTDALRSELIHQRAGITVTIVDLPAVNTPQFDWARAHTRNAPRPMGAPIQPELVADAVLRAVNGRGREYWLGTSTILTILGNAILPNFFDRYLARTAFAGQQTNRRISPDRRDNLDGPVHGLHRSRGSFGGEARAHAPLIDGPIARIGIVALGALAFLGLGLLLGSERRH